MNLEEVPQIPSIPSDVDAFIERYAPKSDYSGQWTRLRPQLLHLVREAKPTNTQRVTTLLSPFGPLLAEAAASNFEGSLLELLNERGIERAVVRLISSEMSLKRVQNARAILTELHRILHKLPPVVERKPKVKKTSSPISADEIQKLIENLTSSLSDLHLHFSRRLVLALGAGLIGDKADKAQIFWNEGRISLIVDSQGRERPLSQKWIQYLSTLVIAEPGNYKIPDSRSSASWIRELSLPNLWIRLRDEWLLEQINGTEPAFIQFHKAGITRSDLDRLFTRLNEIPPVDAEILLRNPKSYLKSSAPELVLNKVSGNPHQRGLDEEVPLK